MQEVLSQLVGLQKMDDRIAQIEAVITNMPLQVKAVQDKLEKAKQGQEAITNELSENKKTYKNLETDIASKKELLAGSQKKLSSVQNNKEYESVLRELETLKRSIADGENRLKDMVNANFKYESELATITELEANLEKQLFELSNTKVDEDKELHDELKALSEKRAVFVEGIKKSVLMKYEKIRLHRNNVGIASVSDEVCNGCYMHIPPQLYVDVKKDKGLFSCPHCQRILYYEKKEEAKS